MPVHVTFHSPTAPLGTDGTAFPLLGDRIGNRQTLAVSGTTVSTTAATQAVLARIVATEDCVVEVGANNEANGSNSEVWLAGTIDVRPVPAGQYVSTRTVI